MPEDTFDHGLAPYGGATLHAVIQGDPATFLMQRFVGLPTRTEAAQAYIRGLSRPLAQTIDQRLTRKQQLELALASFRYVSTDEAERFLDVVDDITVCTAALGNDMAEINRNRERKTERLRQEIESAERETRVATQIRAWGGGHAWPKDTPAISVRRARAILSPEGMQSGAVLAHALDLAFGKNIPYTEPLIDAATGKMVSPIDLKHIPVLVVEMPDDASAEALLYTAAQTLDRKLLSGAFHAESLGRRRRKAALPALLALLVGCHLGAVVMTGFTANRIKASFRELVAVATRIRNEGIAVVFLGTSALMPELDRPAMLELITAPTKQSMAFDNAEVMNVCRALWALMEPDVDMPEAFARQAVRLYGQRDWLCRLCATYVERRHGRKPRSIQEALSGLYDATIESFRKPLKLWDNLVGHEKPPSVSDRKVYVDWMPMELFASA